ncbi:uncharacterized protein ACB057_011989 [Neosynchiropus ocellatus]
MSKSFPRLGRPSSADSKSASSRKELQGNSSCMLRIGERLMRAGSEGNLVQKPQLSQSRNQASSVGSGIIWKSQPVEARGAGKHLTKGEYLNKSPLGKPTSSVGFISPLLQRKHHIDNSQIHDQCLTFRSPPSSCSTLPRNFTANCSSESELDRLIMQHSLVERKKEVILDHLRQKYPHHAAILSDHRERMRDQERKTVEASACPSLLCSTGIMAETNLLPSSAPFTRGSKVRASLPVSRTSGPTGVLYLQYGDETKQVRMPGEISSVDTLRAMFVTAFPQLLTMKDLRSPNTAIYMKDPSRNVYFDLDDIRNITSHSCLKLYHRDAAQLVSLVHSEARISKEVLYGSHSPVHRSSQSSRVSLQSLQGSMSPPMVRSMPSSPSRIAYGGRGTRARGDAVGATVSRERLFSSKRSGSLCSSSSAILERRDVMPDEDGSTKSVARVVLSERGPHYPGSLCLSQHDEGGSVSISSSRCSAPPSMSSHLLDNGIPVGLRQYRASVKPLLGYGDTIEQQTRSPNSSLRQSSSVAMVDVMSGSRGNGSTSSTSSVFLDSPLSQSAGHMTPINVQSERIKAMEEQIAGLAGLVHQALSAGVDISEIKDLRSDITGSSQPECILAEEVYSPPSSAPPSLTSPPSYMAMQQNLASLTRNMAELRLQLIELRHLQLSNYQAVSSMLRMAGQELVLTMCDRLAQSEEAMYSRRAKMEEERIHYQAAQERILRQLSELEEYVAHMQTSASNSGQLSISLRDVEEGAINLRRVGEELAIIKGEFPELQMKMRSVLRPELEAVRFLKEEPLKMDSMLKRVKVLTETLSLLRRCVTESCTLPRSVHADTCLGPKRKKSPDSSPKPHPRSSLPANCSSESDQSASYIITQRMKLLSGGETPPPSPRRGHDLTQVAKVIEREAPEGSQNGDPNAVNQNPLHLEAQTHHDLRSSITREQTSTAGEETPLELALQVSQHDQRHKENVDDVKTISLSECSSRSTSSEHQSSVEKPICPSVDKECPPSQDGGRKPLVPPPRKLKAAALARGEERPGELILVGKQEDKRKPVAVQPKPPRHPPEIKPKPKRYPRATLDTAAGSVQNHSEDTETDKQVTHEPLKQCPGKNNRLNQHDKGPPPSRFVNRYCSLTEPLEVTTAQRMAVNKSHEYGLPTVGDHTPEEKLTMKNVTAVFTLPKDNDQGVSVSAAQGSKWPDSSSHLSIHSRGQLKDDLSQLSMNKVQSPDEAGSLCVDTAGDDGPPLPPPSEMNYCSSATRSKPESKDNESDIVKDGVASSTYLAYENPGFELNDDKVPIIVVLEEPIDVHQENQCLSTIFECEEEDHVKEEENMLTVVKEFTGNDNTLESPIDILDSSPKPKPKGKFKFKFPQNKLAAIRQAIRWSSKASKKTEVVCDKEEKMDIKKHGAEYKTRNTDDRKGFGSRSERFRGVADVHQSSLRCVNETCKSTHESIDSLEESIKQLALSVESIAVPRHTPQVLSPSVSPSAISHYRDETVLKGSLKRDRERSLSKRPAPPIIRAQTPPVSKRAKPQPAQQSAKSSEKKQTPGGSTSSSAINASQQ